MADTAADEDFLLALLNSTPVVDGVPATTSPIPTGPGPGWPPPGAGAARPNCGTCSRSGKHCRGSSGASSPRMRWPRPCGA